MTDEIRAAEVIASDQGSSTGTSSGSENSDLKLFSLAGDADSKEKSEKPLDAMPPKKSKSALKKTASKGGKKNSPSDKMKAAKKKAFTLYQLL
jgi:hypothetical protein